jgi:hypothetical protein
LKVAPRPDTTIKPSDPELEDSPPDVAHIVKVERGEDAAAKVLEARIYGTPIEALCGHVWVPAKGVKGGLRPLQGVQRRPAGHARRVSAPAWLAARAAMNKQLLVTNDRGLGGSAG